MTAQRPIIAYQPRLLPALEAARFLGISETLFRGLGIRSVRIGRKRLWDRLDLEAYASDLHADDDGGGEDQSECDKRFGVGS